MSGPVAILLVLLAVVYQASCANITVDDSGIDPTTGNTVIYSPASRWSFGPACTVCTTRPDPSKARNGTWHNTKFDASSSNLNVVQTAAFTFSGTYGDDYRA